MAYEDGVQVFGYGTETNISIWINSDIMYIVDGAFTFVKNGMQISAHVGDMLYCDNPSALQSDMNSRGELIWMQIGGVDYFELLQNN